MTEPTLPTKATETKAATPTQRITDWDTPMYAYWAYGSNLNVLQMKQRCPSAIEIETYTRTGFKLEFRTVANVRKTDIPEDQAPGAIYLISARDLFTLDRYEGANIKNPPAGKYQRLYFTHPRIGNVYYYRMNAGYATREPALDYLDRIRKGYRKWGLPMPVLEAAVDYAIEHETNIGFARVAGFNQGYEMPDNPKNAEHWDNAIASMKARAEAVKRKRKPATVGAVLAVEALNRAPLSSSNSERNNDHAICSNPGSNRKNTAVKIRKAPKRKDQSENIEEQAGHIDNGAYTGDKSEDQAGVEGILAEEAKPGDPFYLIPPTAEEIEANEAQFLLLQQA